MMTTKTTFTPPRLSTLNPSKSRHHVSSNNMNNTRGAITLLSNSERDYILQACRDNVRQDGRSRDDLREYTLLYKQQQANNKNAPPLVLSNGSSRILLMGGDNALHILCSCKAELVQPSPLYPHQGVVELHVDILQNQQQRQVEENLQMTLSKLLLLKNNVVAVVDLEKLCIVPGAYVWRLGLDIFIMSASGGSVLDACSRVIRAALLNTLLPNITPISSNNTESSSGDLLLTMEDAAVLSSKKGAQVDLQVDGDIHHAVPVPGVEECPIVVTVHVLKCPPKHSVALVVDATLQEEACAVCQVRVAVDVHGNVCALHNQGPLEASLLGDVIRTAVQASKKIFAQDVKMFVQDNVKQERGQEYVETTTLLQDQFQFR